MKKIICIGDSNTWGWVAGSNGDREKARWTKILESKLVDSEIIELGTNGRVVINNSRYLPSLDNIDIKTLINEYDEINMFIIMLGTNDMRIDGNNNVSEISESLVDYVCSIQKIFYGIHNKYPNVLLVTPPHINELVIKEYKIAFGMFDEQSYIKSKKLYNQLDNYIEEKELSNIKLIDSNEVVVASEIDGIHLDKDNHKKLAQFIFEKINNNV